ncbi:bifunctional ADP-dependent NAD(P)H-hydrate dehydratase/NAD(P)H-hydrate epimerase [Luteimonas pelagia]
MTAFPSPAVPGPFTVVPPVTPLFDVAGVRRLETEAIGALRGDGFELMRRAGRAAWRCALRHWPQAQSLVVACGPGNNGGDALVFARYALDSGRAVRIVTLPGRTPAGPLPLRALADCATRGVRPEPFAGDLPRGDLVVDGLFGIGLDRPPEGDAAALVEAINGQGAPVLALDVPSGLDADRGSPDGACVDATRTLEFLAAKAGLRSGPALDLAGTLELADLDVAGDPARIAPVADLLAPGALGGWLVPRARNAHKGRYGRVLCIGGDIGHGGAIALCAEAALRCGAGLVEVATREPHVGMLLARRPEAMPTAVERAADIAAPLGRAQVIAIGPGLGQDAWGRVLLSAALSAGVPLVLDADALNLLGGTRRALPAGSIVTPHPGEAGRLLGCDANEVQRDRRAAAHALATRLGAVVVLKGAGTIVAAPDARPRILDAGNPGMASGGMGDVLTGVVAALRAQGLAAFDAAAAGALLHAHAGDRAAAEGGMRGLLAGDLMPWLRRLSNPVSHAT